MLNPFLEATLYSKPVQPVLIEFDPNELTSLMASVLGLKLKVNLRMPSFGFVALAPLTPKLIKKVNDLPGVKMVHVDMQKTIFQLPSDEENWFPTSQSRLMLGAEEAFKAGFTGESVKAGICDTGIDVLHPQLVGNEWYSAISWPAKEFLDENGHGSHCASTIAGRLNYSTMNIAVEGVSKPPIISVKCLGRGIGTGFTSEVINAMATCYDKGCQIISMSLGSEECQGGCEVCPECRMVKKLTDRGVIFAIAAGNSGPANNTIGCPGCSPYAITVAAVDKTGAVADFSSRGGKNFPGKPDVAAPGVNIYSGTSRGSVIDTQEADAGFGYAAISGTSMATPHVAGLLKLLKHKYPDFSAARFKEVMEARGTHNIATGYGIPHWSYF